MSLPDISALQLEDDELEDDQCPRPPIDPDERYRRKLRSYAQSLPYSIEPESSMMELLDNIVLRITQCTQARDFQPGFVLWDCALFDWFTLKYPMPKEKRIALARVYYGIAILPGIPGSILSRAVDGVRTLTRSKNKLSISDLRLPWKPIYDVLSKDLFLSRRRFEYSELSWQMGNLVELSRRFFHPAAINEMLSTFVPMMDGKDIDSLLASQYYMTSFLPLSHPQTYLPMLFKVWESVNSYVYDERMLYFLAQLSELHLDPQESNPMKIVTIPDDTRSPGEGRPDWGATMGEQTSAWDGIFKDVGIYTENQWDLLMCKVLTSMEIPLADGGSLTTGPNADSHAGFEIHRLPKPSWRIASLAKIIVFSMSQDGAIAPSSSAPTPFFTPLPSSATTPQLHSVNLPDYLSVPFNKSASKRTYIAGCTALDSLAKLIASVESFFHPTNAGAWTTDLTAFVKYLVLYFNQRWHKEQLPDCKTPKARRLTKEMRRELIKSLRTVTLLAMFSEDATTLTNIHSAMKSMSVMEPDLILPPVLERAVPALENLTETHRTLASIKALCAVVPAFVSRRVYYPGAKFLVPILQLLVPGIDLNDPSKTLCTASFLSEISQYIKFSTPEEFQNYDPTLESTRPQRSLTPIAPFQADEDKPKPILSTDDEDTLLKETFIELPDWITSFIRRVIVLLENLPEEGPDGLAGGTAEHQVVDAVMGACSQICAHLSDPLYNLVLNMIFDYASTTVRPNAVRAIHQLVECMANANPSRTLSRFFDLCDRNIRNELENGASSVRTTQVSKARPSDATLHWYLAILRGTLYNDGVALLKYQDRILSLLAFLHDKTYSKRGYSWTGKLLSSVLLTLTHTYPLENRFVNESEWNDPEFDRSHFRFWGRLYKPEDVQLQWHVPNEEEIDFAILMLQHLVEPALQKLKGLLRPEVPRDAVWRNDFCRHLSLVRNAFSGIPTLCRDKASRADFVNAAEKTDFLRGIPEMFPYFDPVSSCFALTDSEDPRHQYIMRLRNEFGEFLHAASQSLLAQGQENTVDAVQMLVRSIRTFMLDYADYQDRYSVNEEQLISEVNIAMYHLGQKEWPRFIWVRRARFYNAARLRWNRMERLRGPLQELLIDDVVQWCLWQYAVVRHVAQSLLESICSAYDGVGRRAFPILYQALAPGSDEGRIKGALWTLAISSVGQKATTEPTFAPEFFERLFSCQEHEKASIQDDISVLSENCMSWLIEPSFLYDSVDGPYLADAVVALQSMIPSATDTREKNIVLKCRRNVELQIRNTNGILLNLVDIALRFGESPNTHWKYAILATRILRTLTRRDVVPPSRQVAFFLKNMHNNHPSIRFYAHRAIIKLLRNLKHYTYCPTPTDLILGSNRNPLKVTIPVSPSHTFTSGFLDNYRNPLNMQQVALDLNFYDGRPPGWVAWPSTVQLYKPPHQTHPTFQPWNSEYQDIIAVLKQNALDREFWSKLSARYSEEADVSLQMDHVSCIKSIFQVLDNEPLEVVKPVVLELLEVKLPDQQRGAAEFIAGIIRGSKHWPMSQQRGFWDWLIPLLPKILSQDLKTDTLAIWTSFLTFVFYRKDPRRVQPLVDFLVQQFQHLDFNLEISFDVTKIISLFGVFYSEASRKFLPHVDWTVSLCWGHIANQHDDVRSLIADILSSLDELEWQPRPSIPSVEVFVKECEMIPEDDIMQLHGTFHKERIEELCQHFVEWRPQRFPGARATHSTYDRVGMTVCKWLFRSLHEIHALSTYDYILPLVPELLRFTEMSDNDELSSRAGSLLVRMCGVIPPRSCVNPMLDTLFHEVQTSTSWKVRLKVLPLLQVFYFRLVPLISEVKLVQMLEVVCQCLDDEIVEVREMAASTLSGILRLSPRRSILSLKDRFVRLAKATRLPSRRTDANYSRAVRQRHAAALGICALIDSYPYTIEPWMPQLLTETLVEMTYDPAPISTTARKCAGNFKKTHQDTWDEDSTKFNEDQLSALSTLLTGSSYCE